LGFAEIMLYLEYIVVRAKTRRICYVNLLMSYATRVPRSGRAELTAPINGGHESEALK
jgi:hypothetical protein